MVAPTNPKTGNLCVWLVWILLLLCTVTGGALFVLYMILDGQQYQTKWFPIVGAVLVTCPWFFWLLTFIYRLITRALGISFSIGAGSGYGGGDGGGCGGSRGGVDGGGSRSFVGNRSQDVSMVEALPSMSQPVSSIECGSREGRRVQFGGAKVVGEQESLHGLHLTKPTNSSSSSSSARTSFDHDISFSSRESEMPLAFSMVS